MWQYIYLKAVWAHGYWDIRQDVIEVLIANGLTKLLYKHLIPVQGTKDISVHHHRSVRGTAHLQRCGVDMDTTIQACKRQSQ